jgi:hypothetical protein
MSPTTASSPSVRRWMRSVGTRTSLQGRRRNPRPTKTSFILQVGLTLIVVARCLTSPLSVDALPPQENVFDISLQHAISAALYQEPTDELVATHPVIAPVAIQEHTEYRTTPGSPLAAPSLLDVLHDHDNEAWKSSAPDALFNVSPNPAFSNPAIPPPQIAQCIDILGLSEEKPRSPTIIRRQPRHPFFKFETPLWVEASKARVERM